jgi:hypothetical protein
MTSETFPQPVLRQTFLVADLKCYLCGAVSGSIEREQTPSLRGQVALRRPGAQAPVLVADWRRLRCDRCGGALFLDETDVVVRRTEDYNWTDERPRRGRPPKRLVEQRQRELERLEAHAA